MRVFVLKSQTESESQAAFSVIEGVFSNRESAKREMQKLADKFKETYLKNKEWEGWSEDDLEVKEYVDKITILNKANNVDYYEVEIVGKDVEE